MKKQEVIDIVKGLTVLNWRIGKGPEDEFGATAAAPVAVAAAPPLLLSLKKNRLSST